MHVVPRKSHFDPSSWNTSVVDLKEKLLHRLGSHCITEALACQGEGVQLHVFEGPWHQSLDTKLFDQVGGLWIGRSRFPKRFSRGSAQPGEEREASGNASTALVTMADESPRAVGGTGCAADSGAPSVDCARAVADPDRANQGGSGCDPVGSERPVKDESGRPEDPVRRGGCIPSGEAHQRSDDQAVEGEDAASGGASGHIRQVQVLDVQGDPRGLPQVGNQGDRRQRQRKPGLGEVGTLGQRGPGETGHTGQGGWGGAGFRGSGSEGEVSATTDEPVGEFGIMVCGERRLHQPEGKGNTHSEERRGHYGRGSHCRDGHGAAGGSPSRDASSGNGDGPDPTEVQPEQESGQLINDEEVSVNVEAIGLGKHEYKETVGLGKSADVDTFEYKDMIGPGKTKYDIAPDEHAGGAGVKWWPGSSFWSPESEESEDLRSPRKKAKDGMKRRKMNSSTKRKLQHTIRI